MVRLVFLSMLALAIAVTALSIRACSNRGIADDAMEIDQGRKFAIFQDGSVMFAPDGTVARALTDWLEQENGQTKSFELGGTQFIGRSVEPSNPALARLPRLSRMLKAYPRVMARIIGHTSKSDNDEDDLRLSEGRANWVVKWLISNGVASSRLSAEGVGSAKPRFLVSSKQADRNDRITLELRSK